MKDIRDVLFDTLYEIAKKDEDVIFITADADAFSLKQFKENIPDRFINIGVSEQNMVNVAAGLSLQGKKPFVYSIIPFLTMRAYEQIKFNLSGMGLPVVLIGAGAGFSFGFDGPSHHGINDIAIMRSIPNISIFNPYSDSSAENCLITAYKICDRPSYIRLDKGKFCHISNYYSKGIQTTLILTTGIISYTVFQWLKDLNFLQHIIFIPVVRLKPFEEHIILNYSFISNVIVIEENSNLGGLRSIVSDIITKHCLNIKLHSIALEDKEYIEYGSREYLVKKNGITIEKLKELISRL